LRKRATGTPTQKAIAAIKPRKLEAKLEKNEGEERLLLLPGFLCVAGALLIAGGGDESTMTVSFVPGLEAVGAEFFACLLELELFEADGAAIALNGNVRMLDIL
jgi:hypothetical protein